MRAMDAIEPRFRSLYEKICVGNKRSDAKHMFFEGMLLEKGLGVFVPGISLMYPRVTAVLTSTFAGKDQPWFGKSSWGHPDFDRKSVSRPLHIHLYVVAADERPSGPSKGPAGDHD
jgi:salicylate hydroxylase